MKWKKLLKVLDIGYVSELVLPIVDSKCYSAL